MSYSSFNCDPALNNAGRVAYSAILSGTGVTFANNSAIFVAGPAAPPLVAREGAAAPARPSG